MLSLLLLFHTSPGHTEEMEIHGSNTIGARLAPLLVKGFLTHRGYNPVQTIDNSKDNEKVLTGSQTGSSVRVLIAAHGSSTGFNALEARSADIWASSRAVKPAEVQQMAERANLEGLGNEHVIAIDGLAVLVHPSNQINQLSIGTLARVFSGEIRNWSEIGGANQSITLYARDDRSSTEAIPADRCQ
ncbi:phosphate transport system substrate-binding protein [Marinobacter antarcticus]|uniref:Phosphate transport system substrate-binding protein n=2 Tax=Marinobacter antarcticus TaxID=564117 RepID=A0A1M6QLK7_9GAMM|nr:phosphate transport system substrate-binding protein [Marinobacter antarcticus]